VIAQQAPRSGVMARRNGALLLESAQYVPLSRILPVRRAA
jgi:hypothetical protein